RFILHFSGYPMDLKEWEKNFSLGVLVNSGSRVIYIPNENSGPVNLRGFDALGRLTFEMRTDHQVDLSQYDSPGIEILHVTGSGRSVRMKF
ncbi:MAG: hypothetical protein LPK28_03925, partial [Bacteroidota bacterium]|nr:hypothetical protein [Bacteroidota bacterium]